MKIAKAIEILNQHQHVLPEELYPDFAAAYNLSIEALKVVLLARRITGIAGCLPLPGETKE